MTAQELMRQLNDKYGIEQPFPLTMHVDSDTYANVCQYAFENRESYNRAGRYLHVNLTLGPNFGIMFKDIELILEKK